MGYQERQAMPRCTTRVGARNDTYCELFEGWLDFANKAQERASRRAATKGSSIRLGVSPSSCDSLQWFLPNRTAYTFAN